jgi:hypothetical protein
MASQLRLSKKYLAQPLPYFSQYALHPYGMKGLPALGGVAQVIELVRNRPQIRPGSL